MKCINILADRISMCVGPCKVNSEQRELEKDVATINGSTGDDFVPGTTDDDLISSFAGNDAIWAKPGDDTVFGGDGNDVIGASDGNDEIYANGGNDTIYGGEGEDTLGGGDGEDEIWGGADDDIVFGGADNDILGGGAGHDTIYGGAGNDTIYGGSGSGDVAVFDGLQSDYTITEGDGDYVLLEHEDTGFVDMVYGSVEELQFANGSIDVDDLFEPADNDIYSVGTVHEDAITPEGDMYWGSGNTPDNFVKTDDVDEGVQTAIKVKHRQGADYDIDHFEGNIAHYNVLSGSQSGNAARAEWNFDVQSVTGLNGDGRTLGDDPGDIGIRIRVDIDPTDDVNYMVFETVELSPGVTPVIDDPFTGGFGDGDGTIPNIWGESGNFGFGFLKNAIDIDLGTPGIQPYDYSEGEFDIEIESFVVGSGEVLTHNHIVVHVEDVLV